MLAKMFLIFALLAKLGDAFSCNHLITLTSFSVQNFIYSCVKATAFPLVFSFIAYSSCGTLADLLFSFPLCICLLVS